MRSSYKQFGFSSLDRDAEDLVHLLLELEADWFPRDFGHGAASQGDEEEETPVCSFEDLLFVGHSTGCQDVIHFLKQDFHHKKRLCFAKTKNIVCILQGAVSDREAIKATCDVQQQERVRQLKLQIVEEAGASPSRTAKNAGKGRTRFVADPEFVDEVIGTPACTHERFLSLTGKMTCDDMFSTDLTDKELREIYGGISSDWPVLVPLGSILQGGANPSPQIYEGGPALPLAHY